MTSAGDAWFAAIVTPDNPLQVWFALKEGSPTPKVINNHVFMNVATNKLSSATCHILEGRPDPLVGDEHNETVNCPPGTLVSLPQPTKVTFPVWANAISLADASDGANTGPTEVGSNGPFPPDAWASGGNGRIRVVWNEADATSHQVGSINGYRVEYRGRRDDGSWSGWNTGTVKAVTDSSHTITGLTEGVWQVRVRAKTDGDDGNPSTTDSERLGTTSAVRTVSVSRSNSNLPEAPNTSVVVGNQKLTVT